MHGLDLDGLGECRHRVERLPELVAIPDVELVGDVPNRRRLDELVLRPVVVNERLG